MRKLFASAIVAFAAVACSGPAKKTPDGPAADDVPQEVTCCVSPPAPDGMTEREIVPLERCPEEQRNPVDTCNTGPGDNEPSE